MMFVAFAILVLAVVQFFKFKSEQRHRRWERSIVHGSIDQFYIALNRIADNSDMLLTEMFRENGE